MSATAASFAPFISFEGIDGSGKTTQIKLLQAALERAGLEVVCLREPGGCRLSESIRALLLDPANEDMSDMCELLLFEASRAQLVDTTIVPAKKAGKIVLCDRFFDSTFAYQAAARDLSSQTISLANELGAHGCIPDMTLIFDIDAQHAFGRATQNGADRLEAEGAAFQQRVREGYLELAKTDARYHVLDAQKAKEAIHADVCALVSHVCKQDIAPLEKARIDEVLSC